MPKKWSEVAGSPQFQSLAPDQQEAARSQYFDQVVAPQVSDPSQLDAVRSQFDQQTGIKAAPKQSDGRLTDGQWQEQLDKLRNEKEMLGQDNTFGQNLATGYIDSFVKAGQGIKQAATTAALNGASQVSGAANAAGLPGVANAVDQNVGAPLSASLDEQTQAIDQQRADTAPYASTGGGLIGGIAGNVAQTIIPAGRVAGAAQGLPLLGRMAAQAGVGAATGALQPVGEGDSRAVNTGVGAALGGAGEAVGAGLGAIANRARQAVDPLRERAIQYAQQSGIPLHLSQVSKSLPAKLAAGVAQYLPFSGAARAADNQQGAFNTAISKTFGADAGQLTDDVMNSARKKLSGGFEDIYNRNDVPLGGDQVRRLADVFNSSSRRLTEADSKVVNNQLDDILGELNDSGVLTGQKYQSIRTQIMKAEGPDKVGQAVGALRKELDDIASEAVGPDDSAALKTLRGQWANFRTTQKALQQVSGAGGDVKPTSLWPLIKSGSTKEMRELARLGQVVMKDPIPNNGLKGGILNSLYGGALGASVPTGALAPIAGAVLGGATVGRALNSSTLARLAASAQPGAVTGTLARLAAPSSLAAVPVVTSASTRGRRKRKDDATSDDP